MVSHDVARQIMRRAGYPEDRIEEVLCQFPDPIDTERDAETLAKYGMDVESVMDRLGTGP